MAFASAWASAAMVTAWASASALVTVASLSNAATCLRVSASVTCFFWSSDARAASFRAWSTALMASNTCCSGPTSRTFTLSTRMPRVAKRVLSSVVMAVAISGRFVE